MSAAPVVLPLIWATIEAMNAPRVTDRKGPHRLRLVQANAPGEAPSLAPRRHETETAEHGNYAFYRKYTEGMLRRSARMSLETARVPSFLGRQILGNVTGHKVEGFDDAVIFVADIDKCVARLDQGQQHLIKRIGLQEYTLEETAAMLGISLRTIVRRYNEALDDLTRIFLVNKVMEPLMACQEVS